MSQLTHRGWHSLPSVSWLLGESSPVSGARGGPLGSRNALEVFLQTPLLMLKKPRLSQHGPVAAGAPAGPALLLLRLRR